MTESIADLPGRGVRICMARSGDGPPLLVISGSGSDLRNTPNALRWPIATEHDVVTYDHRCLGRTEQHDADMQPSMADFAEDALALCDHLGWDRFAVIGVSFGGMVAQEVAIRAPDRVAKLVLCCTSSGGEGGASYPLHELPAGGPSLDERMALSDVRAPTDDVVAEQIKAIFARRSTQAVAPSPALAKQIEARRLHDTWDRLGAITAPTLIAYGRYDGTAPPNNSEAMASRIAASELAGFEGGHLFLVQDPTAWPSIGEFLRRG